MFITPEPFDVASFLNNTLYCLSLSEGFPVTPIRHDASPPLLCLLYYKKALMEVDPSSHQRDSCDCLTSQDTALDISLALPQKCAISMFFQS